MRFFAKMLAADQSNANKINKEFPFSPVGRPPPTPRHTPAPPRCPSFAWSFCFLGIFFFFLLGNSLVYLSVFCFFSRVLRVRKVRKLLGVFQGFPWHLRKDHQRRIAPEKRIFSEPRLLQMHLLLRIRVPVTGGPQSVSTGVSKRSLGLRWPGDSQRESGWFAWTDSRESIRRKTPIFKTFERFAQIASNLRFAIFQPPRRAIRKKGVQFGNPATIRENQAIRANLRNSRRIDSRESGPLSSGASRPWGLLGGLSGLRNANAERRVFWTQAT